MIDNISNINKIKKNLNVIVNDEITLITLAAICKDNQKNLICEIPCFKGMPINGYIYNTSNDSYCVSCYDYIDIGSVPLSISLKVDNSPWFVKMPIPEDIIFSNIKLAQKRKIKQFKEKYSGDEFYFNYFQIISVN